MTLPSDKNWERLYDALGMRDFFEFITASSIQDDLLPIKVVFMLFAIFFLCAVIYFYFNSSYLRYQFLQDVTEFFSWKAHGTLQVDRRWSGIMKKIKTGSEKEYKLAIVEADDFLRQELEDADYHGETFEEITESAGKKILPNYKDILEAHKLRDSIVYDVDYKLDSSLAKKVLGDYERAIRYVYSY